ncbi:MAG: hypothetical protein IIX70_01550, partial [Oscillospiraceae bacterium]|nr:hypothetical protein [Oscillospiraceae bacterium]
MIRARYTLSPWVMPKAKEITDTLEELDIDANQIDAIYENIESMGIEIVG